MERTPTRHRTELLMPAGDLERLKVAILYGADAVYFGTPDMSLRTKSAFSLEETLEGIAFAHAHGKRAYLTLNLFTHNKDIPKLESYIATLHTVKPDGVIVADPGVFQYIKDHAPELELHISTQANICSWLSVDYWKRQGASLCVLAREVSYAELVEIREKCPDVKLEVFVHGAMCMTYSGRCMLSNYMVERGANQGNCANSCRWKYKVHMRLKDGSIHELELTDETRELFDFFLEEEHRPGELMPIEENDEGTYILNAKDLCLMPKLDEYLRIGVDSFKVEGRNKSAYYVAMVARTYRKAIDDWYRDPTHWSPEPYMKILETVQNRGYSLAFHDGRLTHYAHNFADTHSLAGWEVAGIIERVDDEACYLAVKNKLVAGDVLEFISPYEGRSILLRMYTFEETRKGKILEEVHAGQKPVIRIPYALFEQEEASTIKKLLPPLTLVRKEKALSAEEWNRLKLDKEALALEQGKGSESSYQQKREALHEALAFQQSERQLKTPRIGVDGCCGRGCNGCLMFWHEPVYTRARELLAQKKAGEMLDRDMREVA